MKQISKFLAITMTGVVLALVAAACGSPAQPETVTVSGPISDPTGPI